METKINKPTRLRMLVLRHLQAIDKDVSTDKIESLEQDIQTFVKGVVHNVNDLGLTLSVTGYIGDLD